MDGDTNLHANDAWLSKSLKVCFFDLYLCVTQAGLSSEFFGVSEAGMGSGLTNE